MVKELNNRRREGGKRRANSEREREGRKGTEIPAEVGKHITELCLRPVHYNRPAQPVFITSIILYSLN